MSKPVYLIGIGSPFGADSLGWLMCEQLSHVSTLQPALQQGRLIIEACRQPANLLHYFDSASTAIIVDAMQGDNPYGTILTLSPDELEQAPIRLSSHGFGLNDAIHLAQTLQQLPDTTLIIGMDVNEQVTHLPDDHYCTILQQCLLEQIQQAL